MVVVGAVSLALAFYLVIANAGYATFGASITRTCSPTTRGAGDRRRAWPSARCLAINSRPDAIAASRTSPRQVALEVTSAIPLQLHPSRECIKSLLSPTRRPRTTLIDGESPSTPTRRRSSSQGDDDLPTAGGVEHVAITLGFWQERWPSRSRSGRWERCCRW